MDVAYGITPASTMLEVKLTANNADTGLREIHILTLMPIVTTMDQVRLVSNPL